MVPTPAFSTKPKDWSPRGRFPAGALAGDLSAYVDMLKKHAEWATGNPELVDTVARARFDPSRAEESYLVSDNLVPWVAAHFLIACSPVRYVIASTRPDRHPDQFHLEFHHPVSDRWITLDPRHSRAPLRAPWSSPIDSDDLASHLGCLMGMAGAKTKYQTWEDPRSPGMPCGVRVQIYHPGPEEWVTLDARSEDDTAWTAVFRENLP